MFERKCPNKIAISAENAGVMAAKAAIDKFMEKDEMDPLEASEQISRSIETSVYEAGKLTCQLCQGVIVNLGNGALYCGREVPGEVIQNNKMIESN